MSNEREPLDLDLNERLVPDLSDLKEEAVVGIAKVRDAIKKHMVLIVRLTQ